MSRPNKPTMPFAAGYDVSVSTNLPQGFTYLVARITEIGISEAITPDIEARMHLLKMRARDALGLLPNARWRSGQPSIAWTRQPHSPTLSLASSIYRSAKSRTCCRHLTTRCFSTSCWDCWRSGSRYWHFRKRSAIRRSKPFHRGSAHILREQLRQIQKELGDDDVKSTEIKELVDKIERPECLTMPSSKPGGN